MSVVERKKRQLDPAATRRAILDSAARLFAERGFDATSMGDIAKHAEVTKSLVQYHYLSKELLWEDAMMERARPFLNALDEMLDSGEPVGLQDVVALRFEAMRKEPIFARLLGWASLRPDLVPDAIHQRAMRVRENIIRAAQAGTMRTDINPAVLTCLMFAAMDGYFQLRKAYEPIIGENMSTPEFEDAYLEALYSLAFGYDKRLRAAIDEVARNEA